MRWWIGAVVLSLSTAAYALPPDAFHGKPAFESGNELAAWVWHDDDGLHVRFTTVDNKVARHFSGKVCGETVSDVHAVRTDMGDGVKVGPDGHCVVFDFNTNAGVDGFDFRMVGSDVAFDFNIDGKPFGPKHIHVGKDGVNPEKNPFVLNRPAK